MLKKNEWRIRKEHKQHWSHFFLLFFFCLKQNANKKVLAVLGCLFFILLGKTTWWGRVTLKEGWTSSDPYVLGRTNLSLSLSIFPCLPQSPSSGQDWPICVALDSCCHCFSMKWQLLIPRNQAATAGSHN